SYSLMNREWTATPEEDAPEDGRNGWLVTQRPDRCECIKKTFELNKGKGTFPYSFTNCNSNWFAMQLIEKCDYWWLSAWPSVLPSHWYKCEGRRFEPAMTPEEADNEYYQWQEKYGPVMPRPTLGLVGRPGSPVQGLNDYQVMQWLFKQAMAGRPYQPPSYG